MGKKYIPRSEIKNYLRKGYSIGNSKWVEGAYVYLYNRDTDTVMDEKGRTYAVSNISNDFGDYFIVSAPETERKYEYDKAWISRVYKIACQEAKDGKVRHQLFGKDSNGIMAIDLITGKAAITKCHPDDDFSVITGTALAYARLRGMTPKYVKQSTKIRYLRGGIIKYKTREYWVIPTIYQFNGEMFVRLTLSYPTNNEAPKKTNDEYGSYSYIRYLPLNTEIPNSDIVLAPSEVYKDIK